MAGKWVRGGLRGAPRPRPAIHFVRCPWGRKGDAHQRSDPWGRKGDMHLHTESIRGLRGHQGSVCTSLPHTRPPAPSGLPVTCSFTLHCPPCPASRFAFRTPSFRGSPRQQPHPDPGVPPRPAAQTLCLFERASCCRPHVLGASPARSLPSSPPLSLLSLF